MPPPWGMGGILVVNDEPQEYFADAFTPEDEAVLDFQIGNSAGQQVAEALAVLTACRLWRTHRLHRRFGLMVQSDSISALTLLVHCRVHGGVGVSVIACELALDLAEGVYRPALGAHIPGITNLSADALSRWTAPGGKSVLPPSLMRARRVHPEQRSRVWWRTLAPPPA